MTTEEFVRGLRNAADFFEARPELLPPYEKDLSFKIYGEVVQGVPVDSKEGLTKFHQIVGGRIEKQAVAELSTLFEGQTDRRDIVLDLKDVGVIDREAMRFFVRCEADGVQLENCTPYIREWMEREKD